MPGRPSQIALQVLPRRLPVPTSTAWRLAFVGFGLTLAALNTGNNILYLLVALMLAALPLSWLGLRLNLRSLAFSMRLPPHPRAGTPFVVEVTVDSGKRFLAARSVEVLVVTDAGTYGPVTAERIDAGTSLTLAIPAREPARGVRRIQGVVARSVFPFGLVRGGVFVALPRELLVFPAPADGHSGTNRAEPRHGAAARSSRIAGIEPEGSRRGDDASDVRQVDWKSTARRGELMLRETVGEAQRRVDLDVRSRLDDRSPSAVRRFERELSAAVGRAGPILEGGGTVRLTVDGTAPTLHTGPGGRTALSVRLARLVPSGPDGQPLPGVPPETRPGPAATESIPLRETLPGRVHRGSAVAGLAVSVTALLAYGGIHAAAWIVLILSLFANWRTDRFRPRIGGWLSRLWNAAGVAALVLFVTALAVGGNPLTTSILLLTFITLFQIHNAWCWKDDRRMLLISLLHLILASALTTDISFAVFLLGWTLAAIHAQLAWTTLGTSGAVPGRVTRVATSAPRIRYVWPAVSQTLALLVCGSLVFLVVPHFGTGTFGAGRGSRSTGFSDEARLGDIGRIKLDNSPVMDVRLRDTLPAGVDLRWRGLALETFDGRKWSRTWRDVETLTPDREGRFRTHRGAPPRQRGRWIEQEIRLEPMETQVLFAAERPEEVITRDFRVLVEDAGSGFELRRNPGRPVTYTVLSSPAPRDAATLRRATSGDPLDVLPPNLQLPELDPRIIDLAERLTLAATTRYDGAVAIERWLQSTLAYSLDVRDGDHVDPLVAFLFEGMPAHCEYFATSMVLLARAAGIPARFVAGYLGGETNRFSKRYVVRQSDAHAWVEVYFPGAGWVPFDPTPPDGRSSVATGGLLDLAGDLHGAIKRVWDDYYIGLDLSDQVRSVLVLRDALVAFAAGVRPGTVGLALLWVALIAVGVRTARRLPSSWIWTRQSRRRRLPGFYREALRRLERRGIVRDAGETPAELAARSAGSLPPAAALALEQLTELYYRVRYDGVTRERDVTSLARAILERWGRFPRRRFGDRVVSLGNWTR